MKLTVAAQIACLVGVLPPGAYSITLWGKASTGIETKQRTLEESWGKELESDPETKVRKYASPVKRVVTLLNKMKTELEAESKAEAEMYDKMVCWCETNNKEKTQAIADAENKDVELSADIEARSARFGKLGTKIAQMKTDISDNTAALDQATALREKEAAQFSDEEKSMVQAITNLRSAIAVLSKHQGKEASLLQMDQSVVSGLRVLLRDAATKYEFLVASRAERGIASPRVSLLSIDSKATGKDSSVESALMNALDTNASPVFDALPVEFAARVVAKAAEGSTANTFLQRESKQPIFDSRSSARSSNIYGVLNQMLEEFEGQLSQAQKDEMKAKDDFKALSAAKTAEIAAGKKNLDETELAHSDNQKALSDSKEELENTRTQRSQDVEFLRNLKLQCNDLDDQWKKRSATRAAETTAVSEAIAILTEDDNREMLAKSVSLLELSGLASATFRRGAADALRKAAASPTLDADDLLSAWQGRQQRVTMGAAAGPRVQLSTLATAVQIDSFTKVKAMMDKMVVELKEQQDEEVKFKDNCTNEFEGIDKNRHEKERTKSTLEGRADQLANKIARLTEEIAAAQKDSANARVEIKKAGEQREAENKQFQSTVADQRATQHILQKALGKLEDFYKKGINKVVLAQTRSHQTPPVKFNSYKDNAGASPVIGLIEQILEDSKALEGEATADESAAQAAYETFVKDSNSVLAGLAKAITTKTKAVSSARGEAATVASDLESTNGELDDLAQYEGDMHGQCDFVLKNFDIRQKARQEEIEAIQNAKAIISGSAATPQ